MRISVFFKHARYRPGRPLPLLTKCDLGNFYSKMVSATIVGFPGLGDQDMKRREFIKLIAGTTAVPAFSVARSQEAGRGRRIGILADAAILADLMR